MHYQSEIQSCPFRNVVSIIFIIDSTHVRNTFGTRQDGSNDELMIATKGLPRGTTKFQRDDSLIIALIYGKKGRS